MPFALNNQLWRARRRSGRSERFATAEDLLSAAEAYFDWCDNNPLQRVDYRGNPVRPVTIDLKRPYTRSGLCVYLHLNSTYWRELRARKQHTIEFREVIDRIDATIDCQQFEGAAVGVFNANIISRSLGMGARSRRAYTPAEPINGLRVDY